jgi:hypothetical protein
MISNEKSSTTKFHIFEYYNFSLGYFSIRGHLKFFKKIYEFQILVNLKT